jgi:hypothetical protein
MFSLELWEQREKVQEECIMLQALADAELEDSTFIYHPETNLVHATFVSIRFANSQVRAGRKKKIVVFFLPASTFLYHFVKNICKLIKFMKKQTNYNLFQQLIS